ncbi:hypothetical protein GO299_00268 [Ralstonia solanacearum]|nr:hypothetical protein [Ralstonia solanacearum]NKF68074.1 hypothetical protein [Ralstonia solanacearum]
MKKLLTIGLLALSTLCQAQTKSPVQLLNPSGSTAGQAIVSTGSSTAPAWGNVSTGSLSPVAANTVLGNPTGASAAPTATAVPSCSTSASALNWTSGIGFACNTTVNAATLGGATFASPGAIGSTTAGSGAFTTLSASSTVSGSGFSTYLASPPAIGSTTANTGKFTTLQATGAITPSTTAGLAGTLTNDSANSGSWGEYASNSSSTISVTSGTPANCTSITLGPGDWDVTGTIQFSPAGTTVLQVFQASISTTSATNGPVSASQQFAYSTTGQGQIIATPIVRVSIASNTTVYVVGSATFTTSTLTCSGFIRVRRVR